MSSHIRTAATELAVMLTKKNSDYAPEGEFSNFERAAELPGIPAINVMLGQIGIKYSRLLGIGDENPAVMNYESYRDTLMDLAGYAVITAAYLDSWKTEPETDARPLWVVPLTEDEDV